MKHQLSLLLLLFVFILSSCNKDEDAGTLIFGEQTATLTIKVQLDLSPNTGYIVDSGLLPLEDVEVVVNDTDLIGFTDENGDLIFENVTTGEYQITITTDEKYSFSGFTSGTVTNTTTRYIEVEEDGTLVELVAVPSPLDEDYVDINIEILKPHGQLYGPDEDIPFEADYFFYYLEAPENVETLITRWNSDLDGVFFEGNLNSEGKIDFTERLSEGKHYISVYVRNDSYLPDAYGLEKEFFLTVNKVEPVVLDPPQLVGNTIELNWSAYTGEDFEAYKVYRHAYDCYAYEPTLIAEFDDPMITTHTDGNIAFQTDYCYFITVETENNQVVESNSEHIFTQNNAAFDFDIKDMILHPEEKLVYLLRSDGLEITEFDYINNVVNKTIDIPVRATCFAIGDNGYGLELYVGCDDSKIRIYNVNTFNELDHIYTGKGPNGSGSYPDQETAFVTTDGTGNIYATHNLSASVNAFRGLRSYSRDDLTINDELFDTASYSKIAYRKADGIRTLFYLTYTNIYQFEVTQYGEFINPSTTYFVSSSFDHQQIVLAPYENMFVSGSEGHRASFGENPEYLGQLNGGSFWWDFTFNSSNLYSVFIVPSNQQKIVEFDYSNNEIYAEYEPITSPRRVLFDGENLLIWGNYYTSHYLEIMNF